jgi:hypothetical protein
LNIRLCLVHIASEDNGVADFLSHDRWEEASAVMAAGGIELQRMDLGCSVFAGTLGDFVARSEARVTNAISQGESF